MKKRNPTVEYPNVWTKIIRVFDYLNIFVTLWFNINVTQVQSIHGIVSHFLTKSKTKVTSSSSNNQPKIFPFAKPSPKS